MSATEFGVPFADEIGGSSARERASASPSRSSAPKAAPDQGTPTPFSPASREPLLLPLRDLQEWFASEIFDPSELSEELVERLVRPSATMSGRERVEVYRRAYRARLVECLADDYPAVQHALGEEDFDAACRAFIDQHPSRSPSLNFYGRPFAAFLRGWPHRLAAFAADLAELEWALVEVIHAGSSSRLSHAELGAVPTASWAGARFAQSATVRLVELAHPANPYFQSFRQGEDPSPPSPAWSATAVFRDGATLWRMDLSRGMHVLLRGLFGGRSLGEAIEVLADLAEGAPLGSEVMQWFRDWVQHGFFEGIDVPGA